MWSLPSYKIQSRLCFCGSIYSLRNLKYQSNRCYVRTWRSGQLGSTFSKKGGIYVHPWQTNTRLWDVLESCLSNLLSPEVSPRSQEVSSTLFDLGEAPSFAYGSRLLLKSKVVGQQCSGSSPLSSSWFPTKETYELKSRPGLSFYPLCLSL